MYSGQSKKGSCLKKRRIGYNLDDEQGDGYYIFNYIILSDSWFITVENVMVLGIRKLQNTLLDTPYIQGACETLGLCKKWPQYPLIAFLNSFYSWQVHCNQTGFFFIIWAPVSPHWWKLKFTRLTELASFQSFTLLFGLPSS